MPNAQETTDRLLETGSIRDRAELLFSNQHKRVCKELDKLFSILLLLEYAAGIMIACCSAYSWNGSVAHVNPHLYLAIGGGLAIISLPILFTIYFRGSLVTRVSISIAQIVMTALLIDLTGGRIETHFLVFGSLAFLSFYREWKLVLLASVITAIDHSVRGAIAPQTIYGIIQPSLFRTFEHFGWVCFGDFFFIRWCIQSQKEMQFLALQQAVIENAYDDVEDQVKLRTAQVVESEERFRTLCSCAPVAIFEADVHGAMTFVSGRWTDLTGQEYSDALGFGWLKHIHPKDRRRLKEQWDLSVLEGKDFVEEFTILDESGTERVAQITASNSADGPRIRMIGTVNDVTEQKQSEANVKQLALARQREEFLATLSHDLKNPLIGANRVLSLLSDGILGPVANEQKKLLVQLQASNNSLLGLIQNLIAAYRYGTTGTALQMETVNLQTLVAQCVEELDPLASHKQIKIVTDFEESDVQISADPSAIARVLRNLLDNAVKFTPSQGQVQVSTTTSRDGAQVSVRNSGSYIDPEKQNLLFRRFWQGQDGKRYVAGTGLGLYICKSIVESHRGTIECASDKQSGTNFTLTIPRTREFESLSL